MRLRGKVALVTGAGTGIGRGIATMFAREGASVILNGRRLEKLQETAAEIEQGSGSCCIAQGDVTDGTQVERMVATGLAKFGKLDILVNNAGSNPLMKTVLDATEPEWRAAIDTFLNSIFLCSKHALPELIKARGNILNIGSTGGLRGRRGLSSYSAAKGGAVMLTKSMALDFAPMGVRCNMICPGTVVTEMTRAEFAPDGLEAKAKLRPLGFLGEPKDVAYAAVYLASDEARWATGTILTIDGGHDA